MLHKCCADPSISAPILAWIKRWNGCKASSCQNIWSGPNKAHGKDARKWSKQRRSVCLSTSSACYVLKRVICLFIFRCASFLKDCIFVVGLVTSVCVFFFKKKSWCECTERSMSVGLSYTNVKQLDQATSVYRSSESGNGYLRLWEHQQWLDEKKRIIRDTWYCWMIKKTCSRIFSLQWVPPQN